MPSMPPLKWAHAGSLHRPIYQRSHSQPGAILARFCRSESPGNSEWNSRGFWASKPVTRALSGSRNGRSGTLSGAFGGTENHPAPNDPKLGRLHRARQGLVRVPESNTKYGANWGKPGGADPSDLGQVSVSPQGFPSEKNLFSRAGAGFTPLFTGQLYFVPRGAFGGCSGKTHVSLRKVRAGMPAGAWLHAGISGKVPLIPLVQFTP